MLADGPAVSPAAGSCPAAPAGRPLSVSNIVAENKVFLRRLSSVSVFCAWKADYFKCSDGPAVSKPP